MARVDRHSKPKKRCLLKNSPGNADSEKRLMVNSSFSGPANMGSGEAF